eukprot:14140078-Ditylum_brightwellii.AAC.2
MLSAQRDIKEQIAQADTNTKAIHNSIITHVENAKTKIQQCVDDQITLVNTHLYKIRSLISNLPPFKTMPTTPKRAVEANSGLDSEVSSRPGTDTSPILDSNATTPIPAPFPSPGPTPPGVTPGPPHAASYTGFSGAYSAPGRPTVVVIDDFKSLHFPEFSGKKIHSETGGVMSTGSYQIPNGPRSMTQQPSPL